MPSLPFWLLVFEGRSLSLAEPGTSSSARLVEHQASEIFLSLLPPVLGLQAPSVAQSIYIRARDLNSGLHAQSLSVDIVNACITCLLFCQSLYSFLSFVSAQETSYLPSRAHWLCGPLNTCLVSAGVMLAVRILQWVGSNLQGIGQAEVLSGRSWGRADLEEETEAPGHRS